MVNKTYLEFNGESWNQFTLSICDSGMINNIRGIVHWSRIFCCFDFGLFYSFLLAILKVT